MGLKVIAAVGADEKNGDLQEVRRHDVRETTPRRRCATKVKELTGGNGADIITTRFVAMHSTSRSAASPGTAAAVVGFAPGAPSLPANLALLKACDVRGVFYGAWRAREPNEARKTSTSS